MYLVDEQSAVSVLALQERIYNLFRRHYATIPEGDDIQQKALLQLIYIWMINDDAGPLLELIDPQANKISANSEDYQIARGLKFVEPAANKGVLTYISRILNSQQTTPSLFLDLVKKNIDDNFRLECSQQEEQMYANIVLISGYVIKYNDYCFWFADSNLEFNTDFIKLYVEYAYKFKNSAQPVPALSPGDMLVLQNFKNCLDEFAQQNSISIVKNFFIPWINGNVAGQRKNYQLLLDENFRSSLLLSAPEIENIHNFFSGVDSKKYSIDMQIYLINRVFLHAILTAYLQPTEQFENLLKYITDSFLQPRDFWLKIANRVKYPRELISHMRSYAFMRPVHEETPDVQAGEFNYQFAGLQQQLEQVSEEHRAGYLARFDKRFWLSLNLLNRDMNYTEVQTIISNESREKLYTKMEEASTVTLLDSISDADIQRILVIDPLLLCTAIGEVCLRHPNKYIDRFLSVICKPQFAFLNQSSDVNYQNYLLLILYSFVLYGYRPPFRKWFQVFLENADKQKIQELLVSSEAALYLFILALGVLSVNTQENWYVKWGHDLDWESIIIQHPQVFIYFLNSQKRANYARLLCSLVILRNCYDLFNRFAVGFLHNYSDGKQQLSNMLNTLNPLWSGENSQQRLAMFSLLQVDARHSSQTIIEFVKVVQHADLQNFILTLDNSENAVRNAEVQDAIVKVMGTINEKLAVGYTDSRYFNSEFIVLLIKQIIEARYPGSKANSLITALSSANVRSTVQDIEISARFTLKYGVDAKFFLGLVVVSGSVAMLTGIILLSISSGNLIAGATTLGAGAAALLSFGIYNCSTSFTEDGSYAEALSVRST